MCLGRFVICFLISLFEILFQCLSGTCGYLDFNLQKTTMKIKSESQRSLLVFCLMSNVCFTCFYILKINLWGHYLLHLVLPFAYQMSVVLIVTCLCCTSFNITLHACQCCDWTSDSRVQDLILEISQPSQDRYGNIQMDHSLGRWWQASWVAGGVCWLWLTLYCLAYRRA